MEELLNKLKDAAVGIEFPDSTKYIVACAASASQIKKWEEQQVPEFLKGNRPAQMIYLMPEVAHKLSQRGDTQRCADDLAKALGEGFTVDVCPTKNEIIMTDDNFINL